MTESQYKEPEIIVNGTKLGNGHAMTLRVALNAFLHEMNQPEALGDDEHGKAMAEAYLARGREVMKLMMQND